jgi:hypothetical protein
VWLKGAGMTITSKTIVLTQRIQYKVLLCSCCHCLLAQPPMDSCKVTRRRAAGSTAASQSVRKLLADYMQANAVSKEEGTKVLTQGLPQVVAALQEMSKKVEQLNKERAQPKA